MVQISAARRPEPRDHPEPSERVQKKREILDAASRVFRRWGLQAAGMREIAAELGMAVGNLYYYFKNKEELLAFVQEDALAGLLEIAARVRGTGLRADAKLFRLIEEHVVRLNEGTPGSLAHLEVEALGETLRREVQERRDEYERAFRGILEEGIAAGVFRPVDPKVSALAILGAVNWTVKWFRPDGRKSAREIGREQAELLVRGVLADRALNPGPSPDPTHPPSPGEGKGGAEDHADNGDRADNA
jgi:AcrR family transcriptional regulator